MAKSKSRFCCFLCLALLCIISIVAVCIAIFANRRCSEGEFKRAAVAADSQMCSEIGRDMLLQGGSAADAAIAALLCTSLVNPQSMGMGGGAIFTILEKSGQAKVINARERVPKTHRPNLLKGCPENFQLVTGSQWIGIPGEIRAYELVHSRYGRLPWAKLFEPSIRLAQEGFPCPPVLSRYLQYPFIKPLVERSHLCEVFCNGNKTVLKTGEILKYPQLAETMETIAKEGADAFYKGKIARDLIQDVQAEGGTLAMEDLESFQAKVTDAWTVPLGDYTMYIPPPPAGGAILGFILNVMKGFNLTPSSIEDDKKVLTFHRYVEASKFANGQKHNIRDPSFGRDVSWLIKDAFADHIRKMISSDATHEFSYYNVTPSPDHFGTTHVSVLAEDGTAVSVTSTINHIFGSMVYSPKTGIILNNELADFCGKAIPISAGDQPPSSMAPAVLLSPSREKTIVIGASGGSLITTAMALSIINHLWLGKALNESIAAPVVFVDSKNTLRFESGFDESVKKKLAQMGHSVDRLQFPFNVVNGVSKEGRCISAVSDNRKSGKAAGY
ncbi:hypothetical protein MATL_G00086000 [Megalops atlanticus]|uniref:Glutathione hydrolase n=1 Tax=Megalops atlanticus TaxID=7932 RepID=A0A9D3TB37_MEGAT|nr:hypothetical protein MATL_G00086000 [Megalops atlanticus]